MHLRSLFILSLLSLSMSGFSQSPFSLAGFAEASVGLGELLFTPDGEGLIFRKRVADLERNRYLYSYHLLNIATGNIRSLDLDASAGNLSFLEDGRLTGRVAGNVKIWAFPGMKEELSIDHERDILDFSWEAGAKRVALRIEEPMPEPDQPHVTAFEVGPHGYLDNRPYPGSDLHVYTVASTSFLRVTDGTWTVSSAPIWSIDGESLFFLAKDHPNPSQWHRQGSMQANIKTGMTRSLTGNKEFEYNLRVHANGELMVISKADQNPAGMNDILAYQEAGGEARNLTKDWDYDPDNLIRTKGGWFLTGKNGSFSGLWFLRENGKIEEGPNELNQAFVFGSMASFDDQLAFVGSTDQQPNEIYLWTGKKIQRLTDFHGAMLKDVSLSRVENIQWQTDLNMETDGVLTYPLNYEEGKKYPLVLQIHGGPTSSSQRSFNQLGQAMAANDWFVFQPNYRGSDNHGDEFQEAIMNDGGEGPGRDVMAGVELLIDRGLIDTSRIAVTGWSYGGFMTSWLIGRYPNVWRCAVSGAPPIDFTDMTSLSRMNLTLRHAITNSPWVGNNYELHYDMSPLKNLSKVKTPTLIMSKVKDQVVSVTGAYKLYHALLANNIPVKFVAYPGGGHFPSDPVNRLDVYERWIDWVELWFEKTD